MKKFAGLLLCTSIALFSVLSLSGCENGNDMSGVLSDTVSTVSTATVSEIKTETEPQTAETETNYEK